MLIRASACALFLLTASAQAGTVLEMLNRDLANKREGTAKTYAQAGKMRIESGSGAQDTFAIFRDETIYTLNPKDKTYIAMDRATMQQLAAQLNPALKMLQEQMANMSPEQRAQVERMVGNKLPGSESAPAEEVRKTARTGKVAGYACTYAEILQNGVLQSEACVAPPSDLQGSKELYDAALKVSALVKDMMASVDSPWIKQMMNREIENFQKLGGVPLMTRVFDEGKPIHEATLKSLHTQALAASLFEIPAGYKKQDLPNMPQSAP